MGADLLEKRLKESVCRDLDRVLSFFLWAFLKYEPYYLSQNAEWFGLSRKMLNEVEAIVKEVLRQLKLPEPTYGYPVSEHITRVAVECLESFSSELERVARERISELTDLERRVLRHASLWIRNRKSPDYLLKGKVFRASSSDVNELVESLCATLKIGYSQVVDLAYKTLARTSLAFAYSSKSRKHVYYGCIIPKYALSIIEELAAEAEEELQEALERLRNLSSMQLAAIAGELLQAHSAFEAVYGVDTLSI